MEAHGTGTELGDPIEVQALGAALCHSRSADHRLRISSVKTNIGHLEAAAGIAGLIKVVLSLQAGEIPPQLHLATPNPLIAWSTLPIDLVTRLTPWTSSGRKRFAGVSSFGFGGTNAHVILEEAPALAAVSSILERPAHVLVLSGRDKEALAQRAAELKDRLAADPAVPLADVCFTCSTGRTHFSCRAAIVASDQQEAIAGLANVVGRSVRRQSPKVAFLFTGQGSQYPRMGRRLFETQPTFRQALLRCDAIFQECRGRSLIDLLYGDGVDVGATPAPVAGVLSMRREDLRPSSPVLSSQSSALLDRTLYAQPALFALEWSLAQMWVSWGIVPAAVMGHSLGEYVAACVAGVFPLEDGLRLVAERASLMEQAPGSGRMIAVFASVEQVAPLLDPGSLSIAAIQSDREIVVSGHAAAIERLTGTLKIANIAWAPLRVSHAFHSPLMEPILPAFRTVAEQVRYAVPAVPVVSNLFGQIVRDDRLCQAEYWVRHVREPVRFAAGLRALLAEGVTAFVEVGPHPVLVSIVQRATDTQDVLWLGSLQRDCDDWRVLLASLGQLYVNGAQVDWRGFDRDYPRRKRSLPTYPFQRQRHWFESRADQPSQAAETALACDADQWLYDVRWQPMDQQPGIASAAFLGKPADLAVAGQDRAVELARREVPAGEDQLLADLEDVCVDYVVAAMAELGLPLTPGLRMDAGEEASRLGIQPRHHRLFDRLLGILADAGLLTRAGSAWLVERVPRRVQPAERMAALRAQCRQDSVLLEVLAQCGPNLAQVMRGQIDPLTLLFPQAGGASAERLYRDAPGAKVLNALAGDLVSRAVAEAPPGRIIRILEIGAGTGGTTAALLPCLPADRVCYTFTDVSAYFLAAARKTFAGDPRLCYAVLDIDRDPLEQDFEPHVYDIVLAANVLHATPDLRRTLTNIRKLLSPSGLLLLLEGTAARRSLDLTFGLLDGWWAYTDTDLRSSHPLLSPEQWSRLLDRCGYTDTVFVPGSVAAVPGLADQRLIVSRGPMAEIAAPTATPMGGTWLICGDASDFAFALADRLSARGATCISSPPPEAFVVPALAETEATESSSAIRGVIFLADASPCVAAADIVRRQGDLLSAALKLTKATLGQPTSPALWFVTRGAQWVADEKGPADPAQAGLWSLGQVIGLECPDIWGGMVDLDPRAGCEQVDLLLNLFASRSPETAVALRGGLALVPRLVRGSLAASSRDIEFHADATYLLTGGLGATGLAVARWMIGKGARHLALLGRSGLPPAASQQAQSVRRLQALGAEIRVIAADVADRDSLDGALETIRGGGLPIRGLIHAAGVPGSRRLKEIDESELASVLRPKLAGAWNLHELTADDPLDFFVCFSSASSILGADGQGHYAAANRCLDALAAWRRGRGRPALSVNWGRWGTAGMLTTEAHARFAQVGLCPMDPAVAANLLGRLLVEGRSQALVAAVEWNVFKPLYEARRPRPLLEAIELCGPSADDGASSQGELALQLQAAPLHRRREILAEHIERELARILGLPSSRRLDRAAGFFEMGMDSLMAVALRGRLQKLLGRELPKTLAFEYPSVDSLAAFLLTKPSAEPLVAIATAPQATAPLTRTNEAIAIVGAGCRFPGGADDLESFWRILRDGIDAVGEVPASRWDVDRWYDPHPDAPGKMYTRSGGFLEGIDRFDPQFFGIAPREAIVMDPQHRLLLEVAWEALENAGCAPASLKGSRSGVFVGATATDYTEVLAESGLPDAYYITGNSLNAAAGRLSYLLGLHGPSMVVDAACASSLVAVHLACSSLRSGECDLALAGGVNLILSPRGTVAACRAKMLSPSGRCRTFDAGADGFVRGEGCGVIVLKRLSQALSAGDRILAVIRGSAVGQDGASGGLTVPNASAQQEVIRRALDDAAVGPSQIDYVEAHGTGTSLGDPIEVRALGAVFAGRRQPSRPLLLGSVKTNLGHLESASGIASLIKIVLSFRRGQIPAHLHLRELNPAIDLAAIPAVVPTTAVPWAPSDRPRLAGVSSFGASGTLAHVVLEEPPAVAADVSSPDRPHHVLTLSARTEPALLELARRVRDAVARQDSATLPDTCFTANAGRSHFEHRWAILCSNRAELIGKLESLLSGNRPANTHSGFAERSAVGNAAFAIDPQAALDWTGVRELYETSPVFGAAFDRCDGVFRGRGLSLLDMPGASACQLHVDRAVRLALHWSLAELWRSWGLVPIAVLDPSAPTIAADCVAANLGLEQALGAVLGRAESSVVVQHTSPVEVLGDDIDSWSDADLVIPLSAMSWPSLLDRLGRLYVRGFSVDWSGFDRGYFRRKVQLPTYPFQRQRYWADSTPRPQADGQAASSARDVCPLAGRKLSLPAAGSMHYENRLAARQPAYLQDHRVRGRVVLPATAYLEMALFAGADQFGLPAAVENVSFERPLLLSDAGEWSVHTALTPQPDGRFAFKVFSRLGGKSSDDLWVMHAGGTVRRVDPLSPPATLDSLRSACGETLRVEPFYRELAARGLQFGPAFQGIRSLWRGPAQALGRICLPPDLVTASGGGHLHPALLDACSQVVAAALAPAVTSLDLYLLVGLDQLLCQEPAGSEVWCHAVPSAAHQSDGQRYRADLTIYDPRGRTIATVRGLAYQRVPADGLEAGFGQVGAALATNGHKNGRLVSRLQAVPQVDRLGLLEAHVRQEVAHILGLAEPPDPRTGFFDLGMDSLSGSELVNTLQRELGRPLPATIIFEHGNAGALARHLLQEVAPGPVGLQTGQESGLDDLDSQEMAALFAKTLNEIKGLTS